MTKPNECKWCGCGPVHSTSGSHVKFTCRSVWMADGDCWACSSQCCDGMRNRIQRAIEAIRAANRYYLLGEVALIPDETGNLTQACVLDDVAKILEGVSDDETESEDALEILRGNSPASDRGLASRLLPDLAMILTGCRVGKNKSMRWLNVCRELGLTLKDLIDEAKRQGGTDAAE